MTLAERRVAAGITRARAAYTLHLSMSELDRIESMAQEATPRQALCMAKMYGCKPEELELGLDPDSLHGWRVYHGVGITAMAALVKVTSDKIKDWEDGLRTPSDAEIVRISGVTEIPIPSLMEAEGWWGDDGKKEGNAWDLI